MHSVMLAILALVAAATWAGAAVGAPPPPGLLRAGARAADGGSPVGPTAASKERAKLGRGVAEPPPAGGASADGGAGRAIIAKEEIIAGQGVEQEEGAPPRVAEPLDQDVAVDAAAAAAAAATAAAERSASADGGAIIAKKEIIAGQDTPASAPDALLRAPEESRAGSQDTVWQPPWRPSSTSPRSTADPVLQRALDMFEIEEVGNPDLDDQVPIKKKKSSSGGGGGGDLTRGLTSPYGSSNPYVMSGNGELQTAVGLYCSDQAAAEATYGDIGTWNTGQVTSMANLFYSHCSTKSTFNADISNWDGKCGAESASSYFITS